MNTPSKPESSMRLIIFLVGVMVVIGLFSRNDHPAKTSKVAVPTIVPPASKEEAPKLLPSAGASAALKALRAESKIKDVLYQPGEAVEWQIGVLNDGTQRFGFASYVCDILKSKKAADQDTIVRIVDIVKVVNGNGFRDASLGSIRCRDYKQKMP